MREKCIKNKITFLHLFLSYTIITQFLSFLLIISDLSSLVSQSRSEHLHQLQLGSQPHRVRNISLPGPIPQVKYIQKTILASLAFKETFACTAIIFSCLISLGLVLGISMLAAVSWQYSSSPSHYLRQRSVSISPPQQVKQSSLLQGKSLEEMDALFSNPFWRLGKAK